MLNQYTFLELKRASKQKYKDGLKMAVIGDFATQHLAVAIKGYSQKEGRPLQVLDCDYDQFDAQILDEYSDTYKYHPDFILLAVCSEKLYKKFCDTPVCC